MKNVRWLITALVIAVLGGSAFITTTAAAWEDCVELPNGDIICFPFFVEIERCWWDCPDPLTEQLVRPMDDILPAGQFPELRRTLANPDAKSLIILDPNTGFGYVTDGQDITRLPVITQIQGGVR